MVKQQQYGRLDLITDHWERDGLWRIAPAGCDFIEEGARIVVSEGAFIGEWAFIGKGAIVGEWAIIREGATIREGASIGERAIIGPSANVIDARDLGYADGYRLTLANVDGVAFIGGGCRWMTLAAAVAHCADKDGYDERREALALAQAHATRMGLAHDLPEEAA